MLSAELRCAIVEAAMGIVGQGYRDKARGPVEWDCVGVIYHALSTAGIKVKDATDYSSIADGSLLRRIGQAVADVGGHRVNIPDIGKTRLPQPQGGDVIILRSDLQPGHCGILHHDGELIHASLWMGKVAKQPFRSLRDKPCAAFSVVGCDQ